jgi:hypothetical protein
LTRICSWPSPCCWESVKSSTFIEVHWWPTIQEGKWKLTNDSDPLLWITLSVTVIFSLEHTSDFG